MRESINLRWIFWVKLEDKIARVERVGVIFIWRALLAIASFDSWFFMNKIYVRTLIKLI